MLQASSHDCWEKYPASSRVQSLGLLARHLGMLTDKLDINQEREVLWIRRGDPPDEEQPKLTLPEVKAQARLDELGEQEG